MATESLEEITPKYSITEHWKALFKKSESEYPDETVVHLMPCVEQTWDDTCGPCVIATVANEVHKVNYTEDEIKQITQQILSEIGTSLDKVGTPPEAMLKVLEALAVPANPISYSSHEKPETTAEAKRRLDNLLATDHVCIVAMQTSPDFIMTDLSNGDTLLKSAIDKDHPPERYAHVLNSDGKPKTSAGDTYWNGHYSLIIGRMSETLKDKDGKEYRRNYYIRLDPATYYLQSREAKNHDSIDPKYYGICFIEEDQFLKNWYDTSIDKTINYDHWMIPINVSGENTEDQTI